MPEEKKPGMNGWIKIGIEVLILFLGVFGAMKVALYKLDQLTLWQPAAQAMIVQHDKELEVNKMEHSSIKDDIKELKIRMERHGPH